MQKPYSLPASTVLEQLGANKFTGLSIREAKRRLALHGPNTLRRSHTSGLWRLILNQFSSPLVWILLLAVVLCIATQEFVNAGVVLAVVLLNAAIGLVQQYQAHQTIASLHTLLLPHARVLRAGTEQKILASQLVVGDIVLLEAGDVTPADLRLIECRNLRANQAALTGESVPVEKKAEVLLEGTALADRANMAYQSSVIISGSAVAVVVATGMSTELGTITSEVNRIRPKVAPITKALTELGQNLLLLAIILALVTFVVGYLRGQGLASMVGVSVSLLVSLVPEGLPIVLTVMLALAVAKLYKHKALLRTMPAAEALGSIDVVCLDKTGTLSQGTMTVEKLFVGGVEYAVEGAGYGLSGRFSIAGKPVDIAKRPAAKLMLELAALASTAGITKNDLLADELKVLGDPTETAISAVAAKGGFYAFRAANQHPELLEIPFDQELRYSTSVHKFGAENRYIVKGAAEKIVQLSTHFITETGQVRGLLQETRAKLDEHISQYARSGYRVAALGYVDRSSKQGVSPHHIKALTFVGFFCLDDPIRPEAAAAVSRARAAGLQVMMITGDHLLTAQAVATKLGILAEGSAIHASELARATLRNITVVARATPQDKLMLVERLQKNGLVVAMTGDGINDAPALKKANVGIAMGKIGTDAAVEASDMVLVSDGLDSIVTAIVEGRLITHNLRKAIFHLVATNAAEALLVIGALILGLPLPIVAVQILWMNLVTDGITAMAFTAERHERGSTGFKQPDNQPLFDWADGRRLLLVSGVMTIGTLLVYRHYLPLGQSLASSAALTTMVLFQLFNLYNARSKTISAFSRRLLPNYLLTAVFSLAVLLQLLALYLPVLQQPLQLVALSPQTLAVCALVASTVILVDELRKIASRAVLHWAYAQREPSVY